MKKTLLLITIVIISFSSATIFNGCFPIVAIIAMLSGVNDAESIYALYPPPGYDNTIDTLFYSIYVGSNGKIVRSTGRSNIVFQQIPSGTTEVLNSVRLSNNAYQNNVAIAGNNGKVMVSSNTGLNWITKTPVTSANLNAVDHNYWLFAVGDNGTILYASELITGNLVTRTSGTTGNLRDVTISSVNNQRIIVVGDKGTILRSTNTGNNWDNVSIPDTTFNFYSISHRNANTLQSGDRFVAVGSGGRIYKSTDDGATWQQKTSGTTNTLRSIYFLTLDSGVVVGDNGTIRLTTNGGETWFTDPFFNSPPSRNYKFVSCVHKETNAYFSMSDSIFYVSDNPLTVGINNISTEIPHEFSLLQNYPNPFNPMTNINFRISKSGYVKLVVFDMLGKEIETLVNEDLSAGTYEYEWNGINLPSGVYFYRLTTDNYSETRKMLLLK
ncbi:MAG: T9SS type A sorting domain-containing protein [Ignavibacteria bacterium]